MHICKKCLNNITKGDLKCPSCNNILLDDDILIIENKNDTPSIIFKTFYTILKTLITLFFYKLG